MIKQIPGKIFTADRRGLLHHPNNLLRCMFNYESFQNPDKTAFNRLYVLNEIVLKANGETIIHATQRSLAVFIPIEGALLFQSKEIKKREVQIGEMVCLICTEHQPLTIVNPEEDRSARFLQLMFSINYQFSPHTQTAIRTYAIPINLVHNEFIQVMQHSTGINLAIGTFNNRKETNFRINPDNASFLYVLDGAFEVHGRLLQQGDGLALWSTCEVDVEALCNNALIVLIEL